MRFSHSHTRSLNIFLGIDKGGYYHELFLRGKQFLAQNIYRIKIKGMGPRRPNPTANLPNLYSLPFLPEECKQTNLRQISLATQDQNPQRCHAAAIEVSASPQRFSLVNLLSGASALQQNLIPYRIQAQALYSTQANPFQESACISSALRHTDYRLGAGATQQATVSYAQSNFLSASIEAITREILRK
jgi:hypothetical protein